MKEPSRTFARVGGFSIMLLLAILFKASSAQAQVPHLQDSGLVRFATQTAYSQWQNCAAPDCQYIADQGQAYTSDYAMIESVTITASHDQEVYKWQAITPTNQIINVNTLTFTQAAPQCFTWNTGGSTCGQNYIIAWVPNYLTLEPAGLWTLEFYDDGIRIYFH